MSISSPPPVSQSPLARLVGDFRGELAARGSFPPGETDFNVARTHRMAHDPLPILLSCYERYGPVFSVRILHGVAVFMLGPEANHYMLVSHADNFRWRDSSFGDLIPLLGDGLLTIDGDYHRRARRIMLPAFHHERIAAAHGTMAAETERALRGWRPGATIDVYHWARELALRIAMRALFGLDPDRTAHQVDAAREFERALSFYSHDYAWQMLRGPGTPFAAMKRARARLDRVIYGEIDRRTTTGERGEDILSLLLDAEDDDGTKLSRTHVRDEVMTLLFAGHDTTTSTIAFLFYELSRHPELADAPGFDLDAAIDETLRLYPPAWIGPRRSVEPDAIAGVPIPAGAYVNYSSWASHRLPDVWDDPHGFRPERFSAENRKRIPKGAYVPFGGGSRTCIGMRFGLAEIGVISRAILERFRLEPVRGYTMVVRQTPTIGPRNGLPMVVREAS